MITDYEEYICDMADYLLDNGVSASPLRAGQKVYTREGQVREQRITSVTRNADGKYRFTAEGEKNGISFGFWEDSIGKSVFTKAE